MEDTMTTQLNVVNKHLNFPTVSLMEPASSRYIQIAAEVDLNPIPLFLWSSPRKRKLLADCKNWCAQLKQDLNLISADVFKAALRPPGQGEFVKERPDKVHIARFDVAVLIEASSDEVVKQVQEHPAYQEMEKAIQTAASYTHIITASNTRRIGPVDHSRQGVFLFNYFFADDTAQNLAVWNYTAGWFEAETGLDNSTVLLPSNAEGSQYNIINHCRWDGWSDILPSLIFKKSFHSYVLDNFYANKVAALPILYHLA
jgi:hypothetical protein